MAGYDGYSKSNNALIAESDGKYAASVLARKIKVSVQAIQTFLEPVEWHHTSSHFNHTNYYDEADIDEALLIQMQKYWPEKKTEVVHKNCIVKWLEWGGSRKHPTCTEREEDECTVTDKGGAFVNVKMAGGQTMRKKKTCNGFSYLPNGPSGG